MAGSGFEAGGYPDASLDALVYPGRIPGIGAERTRSGRGEEF